MNPIVSYVLVVLLGYLIGCSNLAYYIARAKGVDIFHKGSRNPGASNAMMLMGWKTGILVGLHDIGKALLAVWLCGLLFPELPLARETAGAACVLGHMFPFYLGFRGGKGFASFFGAVTALSWRFALILGIIIVAVLITDYIVVSTAITVVSYPIYCLATHRLLAAAMLAAVSLIILYKHRMNFVRILKGTEVGLRRANRGELRVDRET